VLKKLAFCLFATASLGSSACTVDIQGSGLGGQQEVIREQRTIPVTGTPDVTVRTFNGSIQIRSWDRDDIHVGVERRASTLQEAKDIPVDTFQEGGTVVIRAERPHKGDLLHFGSWREPSVRLVVSVPRRLRVDVRTGDGAIDAQDLSAGVELRTGDGPIRLQRVEGEMEVSTGDGSVTARDVTGTMIVTTGDGSVEVRGRFLGLRARTGDGPINIDALPGSMVRDEWRISTGDGGVMLRLPQDFNADVEATTGDGGITTSGVTVLGPAGQDENRRRHLMRGRIGTGGEMLTVRTGDGPISVVAR